MKCDPNSYISLLLRIRLRQVLKGNKAESKARELVGCSISELISHLESQFLTGMTWDNHGEWHIDHRRPCSSFDLTNQEECEICFHYTNLQPLWAIDNLAKSDSFDEASFDWEWNGSQWIEKE